MDNRLQTALQDLTWKEHKIGDTYSMINVGGKKDAGNWKIAYYPLFGTYKGEDDNKVWTEFEEPRGLIENRTPNGSDLREVPLRYLSKNGKVFDSIGKIITSDCKLSVQNLKEPIIVFYKNGELYFSPYGKEEKVSSYLRKDITIVE